MKYLHGYPLALQTQVQGLLDAAQLGPSLLERYRGGHGMRSDRNLYDYVDATRSEFLRGTPPISKVRYDSRLQPVAQTLGTHSTVARVQGARLKAKREIRIASLFRDLPEPFLRMIVVHELAHSRQRDHDKAFYQLCCHMMADYHQAEFDLRLVLTHIDLVGPLEWQA